MDTTNITNSLNILAFEKGIYFLVLILQGLYIIFAFIMVRQVKLMNTSVTTDVAPFFTNIARLHLLISVGVVIFSILLL